jgi:nitroimidazol reductase NimA-like FMN-containing flavoprotein (pyridoxamine 5'-phosphate oxidase superfamily)
MSSEDSKELLEKAPVGRLGTCIGNEPYVSPLNLVYDNGKIYFHSAKVGRKLENMKSNPKVCFEVDQLIDIKQGEIGCDFGCYYKSAIISGEARIVDSESQKVRILEKLVAKYALKNIRPVFENSKLERIDVVEIQIENMSGKQCLP